MASCKKGRLKNSATSGSVPVLESIFRIGIIFLALVTSSLFAIIFFHSAVFAKLQHAQDNSGICDAYFFQKSLVFDHGKIKDSVRVLFYHFFDKIHIVFKATRRQRAMIPVV
jgi:hypothetical protein